MDLLGGYDSAGSSSTNSSENDKDESCPKTKVAQSSLPQKRNDTNIEKKRRLLRLNAVLPLARSSANTLNRPVASGGYSSDSSESSNDEIRVHSTGKRQRRAPLSLPSKSTSDIGVARGDDAGISSLLSDLNGIAPTNNSIRASLESKGSGTTSTATDTKEEPLGMAFMNVTSTVINRKKRKNHDSNSNNTDSLKPSTKNNCFLRSSATTTDDKMRKDEEIIVEDVLSDEESDLNPKPQPKLTISQTPKTVDTRMSGFRRGRDAAPRVVTTSTEAQDWQQQQQQQQYYQEQQQQHYQEQQQQQIPQISAKKSRRDLEKALRSGDFSSIGKGTSTDITQNIYRPDNHDSVPSNSQLLATSTATEYTSTDFRSAARNLPAYVPQECGTSTEHSDKMMAKHRSKHQIHSLVTNAKKLEAQRYRMSVMGGTKKGTSSRADAKKKYGW